MEKGHTHSIGEESIEMLEPFVTMNLERTLERALPDIIHRTKFSLIPKISRQIEEVITQQLPKVVDGIISREIEKFK